MRKLPLQFLKIDLHHTVSSITVVLVFNIVQTRQAVALDASAALTGIPVVVLPPVVLLALQARVPKATHPDAV